MSKRKRKQIKGLPDDSIECPRCKVKGKCYVVGGFGFSLGGVTGDEWDYICTGCGAKFTIAQESVDDENEGVSLN